LRHQDDTAHIKQILTQGCPLKISFEELSAMKALIVCKGNQAMFKMHPEVIAKTMNREDRHSHQLLVKLLVLYFPLWCCHTAQGILIKPGKSRFIIFDASLKEDPHEVVLNNMTTMDFEAIIIFGKAKLKLL
jgi:hypothetical protein